jgi:hypothetical protein
MVISRCSSHRISRTSRRGFGKSTSRSSAGFLSFLRSSAECRYSKIKLRFVAAVFICCALFPATEVLAGFAASLSLSLGEEYDDNIFFATKKQSDFVTLFAPTFTLLYVPPSETIPTFVAGLSTAGQIFTRHSELNNFGDNVSLNAGYTYRYSPRLSFHAAETLRRGGDTRTIGFDTLGPDPQLPSTPTMVPPIGGLDPLPTFQGIGALVSKGSIFTNHISLDGAFLYGPNVTLSGTYSGEYSSLTSQGGSDISNSIGIRGIYNWRREHNLHAGYSVTIVSSRGGVGGSGVVHNFDFGDDYLSTLKIDLDPTWTISGSTGVGLNTGGGGPGFANNLSITMIKIWQTAVIDVAVRRGLTSSFGIAGIALTTSASSGLKIRLLERLTGSLGVDYSIFQTDKADFKVFRAGAGLQYWFTNWLSSSFAYSHQFRDITGSAVAKLVNKGTISSGGVIDSNNVFLSASIHFDLWPNLGISKGLIRPLYAPLGAPFSAPEPLQPVR